MSELNPKELAEKNRVTDPEIIKAILTTGFNFSEFQELALYHRDGFFERKVDFPRTMPMLPQLLTPFFGKCVGEFAFDLYSTYSKPPCPNPVFLSLGAGQGYLDSDLISHLTNSTLEDSRFPEHSKYIRENSTFIVSDRTRNSIERLNTELSDLILNTKLLGRIKIERVNALDFDLGGLPFGIVYANELLDDMPTEPIVKIGEMMYVIKLLAYIRYSRTENFDGKKTIQQQFKNLDGLLSRISAERRINIGDTYSIGFLPVSIPLSYDESLAKRVSSVTTLGNIDSSDFGGIYPVHIGLDSFFESIRKSFQHGVIIIIDYSSIAQGCCNWNRALTTFKNYKFGKEDIDFEIDPMQVVAKAQSHGIKTVDVVPLSYVLDMFRVLFPFPTEANFPIWLKKNKKPDSHESKEIYMQMYDALNSKGYLARNVVMRFIF